MSASYLSVIYEIGRENLLSGRKILIPILLFQTLFNEIS